MQHVRYVNLKVLNWQNASVIKIENDGLDLVSSSHSLVEGCLVVTCDDAMCAKATLAHPGPMTNATFTGNVVCVELLLLNRRGRSLPANASGLDSHRDSISSRF
eukprot:COSAG01_NODE_3828_length_5655_cov_3.721742_9_plen_104_part_00